MNIKSNEKKENSTFELVIEVGAPEFQAAIDKVYNRQKKSINVPGFRKGKAPRKMVEKMYGAEIFFEDAISLAYPDAYEAALKEAGIDPVAYPQLEVLDVSSEGFTFKAVVTVKPEVSIQDYKGLQVAKTEVKVSAADIKAELKPYIDRASRLVSVERKAKKGDTAVIDFEGFKDGVPFQGGKGENYSLELGSGSFVPGFEEQVIGMKAGEEKELDITFPENYAAELAGAAVVFKVKVHEIKEKQEPEVDDEFAKDVSEFDTLDEFKKDLGDKLKARRQEQADREFETAVIDALIEKLECDVPEAMIDYQADKMLDDYANRIQSQGIGFEDYLRMMGMTMDDMRAQSKTAAARTVRSDLALEAVAAAEGLEISDTAVDEEISRLAEQYKMEEDKVRSIVNADDIRRDLMMRGALDLVKSSVKKTAKKAEKSEEKAEKKTAKKTEKAAKKSEDDDAEEAAPKKKAASKAKTAEE
ncbi:MAG: trigger factor [Oscillospiraceae bacterium]|nr:trigger factor [Oscillospiraceae bacterium]